MMNDWLPETVCLTSFEGNWDKFFKAVYEVFEKDFVLSKPFFRGRKLGLKRHPEYDGKSATFWHMISEGHSESERMPDLRRCERMSWPKPVIENSKEKELRVWAEPKGSNQRIYLWFEKEGYLVVLEDRHTYLLPWTAFYVEKEHQKRKYMKRCERFGELS
jgi:hypothetical protein